MSDTANSEILNTFRPLSFSESDLPSDDELLQPVRLKQLQTQTDKEIGITAQMDESLKTLLRVEHRLTQAGYDVYTDSALISFGRLHTKEDNPRYALADQSISKGPALIFYPTMNNTETRWFFKNNGQLPVRVQHHPLKKAVWTEEISSHGKLLLSQGDLLEIGNTKFAVYLLDRYITLGVHYGSRYG